MCFSGSKFTPQLITKKPAIVGGAFVGFVRF